MIASLFVDSGAIFSDCGKYRHSLRRVWGEGPRLNMLMLNPSKAGEVENDPTVSRQITRASMLGMASLTVTNIFDFIATDPKDMKREQFPCSTQNDFYIRSEAMKAIASGGMVVCAWGKDGTYRGRGKEVRRILRDVPLHALKVTCGEPWHPLYLPYSLQPFPWGEGGG